MFCQQGWLHSYGVTRGERAPHSGVLAFNWLSVAAVLKLLIVLYLNMCLVNEVREDNWSRARDLEPLHTYHPAGRLPASPHSPHGALGWTVPLLAQAEDEVCGPQGRSPCRPRHLWHTVLNLTVSLCSRSMTLNKKIKSTMTIKQRPQKKKNGLFFSIWTLNASFILYRAPKMM